MSSSSPPLSYPETPTASSTTIPQTAILNPPEVTPQFAIIANRKSSSSIPSNSSSKINIDELSTKVELSKSKVSLDSIAEEEINKETTVEEKNEENSGEEIVVDSSEFKIVHPKLKTKIPRTEILKILYDDQQQEHHDDTNLPTHTPETIITSSASALSKTPNPPFFENLNQVPKPESIRFLSVSSSSKTSPRPTAVDLTHYTTEALHRTSISQDNDEPTRTESIKPRPSIDKTSFPLRNMIDKLKKKMVPLKTANLSIVIDSYDFLFSDFDPRPYNERLLSTDFLEELRRRVQRITQTTRFQLRILIPLNRKDDAVEVLVSERIQNYFQYKFKKKRVEVIKFRIYAATWIILGIFTILLATVANITLRDKIGEYYSIIDNIINPAAWFIIWSGLDLFFIKSHGEDFLKDLKFFQKMKNIQITFQGFEYEGSGYEEMDE